MSKVHQTCDVSYHCCFARGKNVTYNLSFDADTFQLLHQPAEPWPEWTRLDVHRCPNCKLDPAQHSYCPAAVQLSQIVADCHEVDASAAMEVKVVMPHRTVIHTTTAQRALSSLMGLVLAASGCPLLSHFRPMARFHLPVSTDDETMYRAISMYLMSRFVVRRKGKTSGLELNGLLRIYRNVEQVNKAMSSRLSPVCRNDAIMAGLVWLNEYARRMPLAMEEYLDRLHPLFATYLSEANPL
jgi:hypothetical protein